MIINSLLTVLEKLLEDLLHMTIKTSPIQRTIARFVTYDRNE